MPLTLTVTEGVSAKGTEKQLFEKLCEAMLRWHGLSGNKIMTPNVVGSINILPKECTWSGRDRQKRNDPRSLAWHRSRSSCQRAVSGRARMTRRPAPAFAPAALPLPTPSNNVANGTHATKVRSFAGFQASSRSTAPTGWLRYSRV